ncbi:MAG: hypothetical protein ACREV4_01575 [Gammaproteobacteria bacterium]
MEKSLSFFRVFDVAFFVPGVLLFGAFWHAGFLLAQCLPGEANTAHQTLTVVLAIVLIYALGLLCHGIQRGLLSVKCIKQWLARLPGPPNPDPWFANLRANDPRHDLALYFWYMRATCWNLAVAIVPGAMIYYGEWDGGTWVAFFIGVLIAWGLCFLGRDFDQSMRKAAS